MSENCVYHSDMSLLNSIYAIFCNLDLVLKAMKRYLVATINPNIMHANVHMYFATELFITLHHDILR